MGPTSPGNAGGLVGLISASSNTTNAINNVVSSVVVTGGTSVGGIVGRLNTGTLTNANTSGAITGATYVGGVAGRLYLGALTDSVSTSAVTGTSSTTGGLVGYLEHGSSLLNTSSHTTGLVKGVSYVGGLIALIHEDDSITIDAHTLMLNLNVSDADIAARRAAWTPPAPRYTRGVLAKFARNASSASSGAVLDKFD